ncbi:MAG: hypothetical protein ACTSQJ_09920 [Promethearchaeota archaeon]
MAKKKKSLPPPEDDTIPEGKIDEEGDEILDLYEEYDDLADDLEYDLEKVEDEMLTDETEDEEFGLEVSEVEKILRKIHCEPCAGSDSKPTCKVRDDFGCPPGKKSKKKPWTEAERKRKATGRKK